MIYNNTSFLRDFHSFISVAFLEKFPIISPHHFSPPIFICHHLYSLTKASHPNNPSFYPSEPSSLDFLFPPHSLPPPSLSPSDINNSTPSSYTKDSGYLPLILLSTPPSMLLSITPCSNPSSSSPRPLYTPFCLPQPHHVSAHAT